MLINTKDENGNWWEVLSIWSKVANWSHYKTTDQELQSQVKALIGYIWNEKDWLVAQYPAERSRIETFINESKHIKVVADLANTQKHRELTRKPRSGAAQTDYRGSIETGEANRQLYFIQVGSNQFREIIPILRGAIDEYEKLRHELRFRTVA